jgi:hypothetical protein
MRQPRLAGRWGQDWRGVGMTERTIRSLAKELAAQFYDMTRCAEGAGEKVHIQHRGRTLQTIEPGLFAKTYPTEKDYLVGRRHGRIETLPSGVVRHVDDGSITPTVPGWAHWYDQARQMLVAMLANPTTHENLKEGIMAALVEDREEQYRQQELRIKPAGITQRHGMEKRG